VAGGRGGGTEAAVTPYIGATTAVGHGGRFSRGRSQQSAPLPLWITAVGVATAVVHGGRRGARWLVAKSAKFSNNSIVLQND
jgi:hypothetical protein